MKPFSHPNSWQFLQAIRQGLVAESEHIISYIVRKTAGMIFIPKMIPFHECLSHHILI